MRTVVIVNQKGGCGKTTTAINLAGIFASRGLRTLLVDLDPQSHCAAGLAIPEQRIDQDIADALVSDAPIERDRLVWSAGRSLDLIPSRTRLAGLEAARGGLATKPDKERRLARVLTRFTHEYDVALVDCSPSIGLLTYNAITAASDILVPVETGFFSLQGALKQARTIESLQRRLESHAPFWLLPTLHEPESMLAEDLLGELRRRFGDKVIPHAIRRDIKLKEAVSFGQPVVEYAPESSGSLDHAALADWLVKRWETQPVHRPRPAVSAPQPANFLATPVAAPAVPQPEHPTAQQPAHHAGQQHEPQTISAEPKTPAAGRASEIAALARKLRDATIAAGRANQSQPDTQTPTPPAPNTPNTPKTTAVVLESAASVLERTGVEPKPSRPVPPHVLGVRATSQGVVFVQPLSIGRQLAVAGDFNGWSTRANRLAADPTLGVHQACVHLPPGRHRYRLVIDGRWTADPHNQLIEPNEFGETNSVIVVPAPRSEPTTEQPAADVRSAATSSTASDRSDTSDTHTASTP